MKNAEISLEEARNLYKSSNEARTFLLSKFTKEELENKEITQEAFDAIFDRLLKQCVKTVFLKENGDVSDIPTCRVELENANGEWLFDIDYGTTKHFWFDYDRLYQVIHNQTNLQYEQIQQLMIHRVKDTFKLDQTISATMRVRGLHWVKDTFKLDQTISRELWRKQIN